MSALPFLDLAAAQAALPRPARRDAADLGLARWRDAVAESDAAAAAAVSAHPAGPDLLAALFGNSPFLGDCLVRESAFVLETLRSDPDTALAALLETTAAAADAADEAELMRQLRIMRRRAALLVAMADIAAIWPVERATAALSDFAEAAVRAAVSHLLGRAVEAGKLTVNDPANPSMGSGYVVLGMGKLGARELNYSSDIDLIVLFDQEVVRCLETTTPQELFIGLTQRLVRILQSRTADGYVLRTDLRLRPDPGATPIVLSMAAAERYYESVGQNWERAAFIKARPVAGDLAAGHDFLKRIAPFIWRKHLDFAAIADIHSIKRQIHTHHGHAAIALAGHNIKLGRGGIREIEFFVQTQQLIAGGRDPALRTLRTVEGLEALVATGRLQRSVADELAEAYVFLRRLEHRLQMVDDEQTHTLPEADDGLERIAAFMGFPDRATFGAALRERLDRVVGHYGRLFEHAETLGHGSGGSLVFTGTGEDPETMKTLTGLGFRQPATISQRIRSWHHGRYPAMRTARARELLTALVPRLLEAFVRTANPDGALVRFDEFLAKLPSGVQLFSLFYENPNLLDLVAEIMGTAPRLADELAHNALLFDAVLSAGFFDPLPDKAELAAGLDAALSLARDFEDTLDISRRWANEHKFQVGVQILRNRADADSAGPQLSDIADVLVMRLASEVARQFVERHGTVPGGGFAVIALGKLGGRELTPSSDIDLVFVYETGADATGSDGRKPLPPGQYYARLAQRLISSLTALTGEGRLYEVDMRLRPAGNAGPITSRLDAFASYHAESAWTWEHMALTRGRVVWASGETGAHVEAVVRGVLATPRDSGKLARDVAEMRERIAREHRGDGPWDIKYVRGGLVDLEFICQYLVLRHGADHPDIVAGSTLATLERLGTRGLLAPDLAERLCTAGRLFHNVQGLLRLTVDGRFDAAEAPAGLRAALARAGGAVEIDEVGERLVRTQADVLAAFQNLVVAAVPAES